MGLKISKPNLAFLVVFAVGLLISVSATFIFPKRFFFDAYTILGESPWGKSFTGGGIRGSYPFTIWFYKVTGLRNLSFSLLGLIQYSVLCFVFYKIGVPRDFHKLYLKNLILYFIFLLLGLYVSVPSKEFINFIYLSLVVFLIQNRRFNFNKTLIISMLWITFLGFFFREYYYIVVIITLFMYLLGHIKLRNYKLATITYGVVLLIGISLSYGFIKGEYISNTTRAYMVAQGLSNTAIVPLLRTDVWYGDIISIIHGFFSVNIPVNGLKYLMSPQIVIFVVWQLLMFFTILSKYDQSIREGKRNNYDLLLFYIVFSYFIVQGIFEPDLGSALRHKASVFPLIYYLLNYEDFRKKI